MNAILPRHPLDQPDVVKIALGQASSDALKSLGKYLLIIASPADSTAPEAAQGRYILHCVPITQERANDAYAAASGKPLHRVKSPKRTPTGKSVAPTTC